MVNSIPSGTAPDLRQRLVDSLIYGNEFSLRRRLQNLLEGLKGANLPALTKNCSIKDFANRIVTIRNYLTHYDESSKPSTVASLLEMYNLNQQLRAILAVLLLKHLGADEELVTESVTSHLNLASEN